MNDEHAAWAVTTDPTVMARLLELWEDDDAPIEDHAHALGLHPDAERGQRDSVFLLTTPEGEEVLMWEPGPGPYPHEPADLSGPAPEAEDDGSDPWSSSSP